MRWALLLAAMIGVGAAGVAAQAPVPAPVLRILVAAESTGPRADAGRQVADGVRLAIQQSDGRLGGHETVVTFFDLGRPGEEAQAALPALVRQVQAGFVIGRLPQAGLAAQTKALSDAGTIVLVPGWGPADLAGKRCLANVFVTGAQEDQGIDTLAKFADEAGYKRLVLVTSAAGAAQARALKKSLKGEILREVVLDDKAADFSREVAGIVSDKPGAILLLAPAETAAQLLVPLRAAEGMADVPVLTPAAEEESALVALGPAAGGLLTAGNWAQGLDTPETVAFVAAFDAAFGYAPSSLALHAYDAARLIASAAPALEGKGGVVAVHDKIRLADIRSPRGAFTFANNNFPVQDFYVKRIEPRSGGGFISQPVKKVFVQFGDDYAAECPLK